MMRIAAAIGSVCLLAACSHHSEPPPTADITKIEQVKSDFGPGYKVREIPKNGVDPKKLVTQKLPPGLTFSPPDCASALVAADFPPGLQVNMAVVTAEGNGNVFIVQAAELSRPLPLNEPSGSCRKVTFQGARARGTQELVEVPQIEGVQTLGVRTVAQMMMRGKLHTGEGYSYTAEFGDYQVIVNARPMVVQGQPAGPVDTKKARELLVKSVAAIRS